MKLQAAAALGVVLVWVLGNNLSVDVLFSDPALGERTESILIKTAEPIISQLGLVALVCSAVIWLTGGFVRKLICLVCGISLTAHSYLLISLVMDPKSKIENELTFTGEELGFEFGIVSYLLIFLGSLSALLYFTSIKTYSIDKATRPRLNTDRDTWRAQDEGKDGTI